MNKYKKIKIQKGIPNIFYTNILLQSCVLKQHCFTERHMLYCLEHVCAYLFRTDIDLFAGFWKLSYAAIRAL